MPNPALIFAAVQAAAGIAQMIKGASDSRRARRNRKPYKTPQELYDILKAAKDRAGEGYDPQTLQYLTSQVDMQSASALDTARRSGGDPNDFSALYDKAIQSKFRIGAENQLQNLKNFGGYLSALNTIADNKAAEQKSQQDMINDQLQAASMAQQAGFQNLIGGANTAISAYSTDKIMDLYKTPTPATPTPVAAPNNPGGTSFNFAPATLPPAVGLSDYVPPPAGTTSGSLSSLNYGQGQPSLAELQQALDLIERARRQKGGLQ